MNDVILDAASPREAALPPATAKAAVVEAAAQWMTDRLVNDWDEARLMKALLRLHGDWQGCPGCDGSCDEACRAATVDEQIARVDHRLADLVHAGWLLAPRGYEPPADWTPASDGRHSSAMARTVAANRSAVSQGEQVASRPGSSALQALHAQLGSAVARLSQHIGDRPPQVDTDAQLQRARVLLDEVRSACTRDDDLPDGLLDRIDAFMDSPAVQRQSA